MNNRIEYFDILRGVAIFFVVIIHASSNLSPDKTIYSSIVFRNFVGLAVPLFVVLSGYFLAERPLGTKELYISFLKKQIPRVLIPFFVWSIFYSMMLFRSGKEIGEIVFLLFTFQASTPFYFIALIIQFYFLTPVAQKLANKKGMVGCAIISIVFCLVIFYLRYFKSINIPVILYAGLFIPYLLFFVLGIYFGKGGIIIKSRKIAFTLAILCLCIAVIDSIIEYKTFLNFKMAISTVKVSCFLYAFVAICFLFNPKNFGIKNDILNQLGIISFGIYFSHMYFLSKISSLLRSHLFFFNNVFLQIIIATLTIITCAVFCLIAKRIHRKLSIKYLGI